MALKDVLVLVDNDEQCKLRVRLASDLAQHFDGHLTGIYVQHRLGIPNYARSEIPDDVLSVAAGKLEEMAGQARESFSSIVDERQLSSDYVHADAPIEFCFPERARYADLVVLAQKDRNDTGVNPLYDPAPLLLSLGRPALIVPRVGAR